jgi:cell division protein FtsB
MDENAQPEMKARDVKSGAASRKMLDRAQRLWRPAGTAIAVILALLVTWHAIYGNHGLSVWQQKRSEDRALQRDIRDLEQQNAKLREQNRRLQTDPRAIEHEAREKLHYTKPGDVVVTLHDEPAAQLPASQK